MNGKKRRVQIYNPCKALEFDDQALKTIFHFLDEAAPYTIPPGDLSLALLQAEDHSRLHQDYLDDPSPTDVITFPGDADANLAGEICVSIDTAHEYAKNNNSNFSSELVLYFVHGWLHLAGFDDQNEKDRQAIRKEEEVCMSLLETNGKLPLFNYQTNE